MHILHPDNYTSVIGHGFQEATVEARGKNSFRHIKYRIGRRRRRSKGVNWYTQEHTDTPNLPARLAPSTEQEVAIGCSE
jgi:hypothetical protein